MALCIVGMAVSLSGCTNDEEEFPPLTTDFVVAQTNAAGILSSIRLDDGTAYDVTAQGVNTGVADTLLRCVATYTLKEGGMQLYDVIHIMSNNPVPVETFLEDNGLEESDLPRDPVNVISMWKSGGYINMRLGVLTTGNGRHAYAFCKDDVGKYSLLHQRPANDAESYTQEVRLSMPVPDGEESLMFSVNTYDGPYIRTF